MGSMPPPKLLRLAQDLEWLGCELEYQGQKHAQQGFPNSGEAWVVFVQKQRGVLVTADKIERELKDAVRFNPNTLVGVEFPLQETLDSLSDLVAAVEDIKDSAVRAVQFLPPKVRKFTRMVTEYLDTAGALDE
jgi:hypothetical protein